MRYVLISHISNQETNRMMKIIKKPISITLYTDEKRLRQTEVRERLFAEVSLLLHILCFANDFVLITKTAYECKHSTQFC